MQQLPNVSFDFWNKVKSMIAKTDYIGMTSQDLKNTTLIKNGK